MNEDQSNEVREDALKQATQKGVVYEELVRSKGWEFIKAYIENQIKTFANEAIITGFKDHNDYLLKRGIVVGMRSILGEVQSSLKTLEDERKKTRQPAADK